MTRMSRTIGLVLLGGAALSTCCCVLQPRPAPAPPPPQQFDENGNPVVSAQTTGSTGHAVRRHGPLWVPWYWGGSGYSPGYRPGPGYRSGPTNRPGTMSRPGGASPGSSGGSVARGGFGSTGHGVGGAAA